MKYDRDVMWWSSVYVCMCSCQAGYVKTVFSSAFFLLLFFPPARLRSALYFQPCMYIRPTYKLHLNNSMCSWALGGAHILSLSASLRLLSKSVFFLSFDENGILGLINFYCTYWMSTYGSRAYCQIDIEWTEQIASLYLSAYIVLSLSQV